MQAVIIAFCFGALLEALAGFGTPVAISSVMLIGLGFQPIKAAAVALVANTAPVAFGAIAMPITTLAPLANLPKDDLGAMVGRQTPFLALIVPLILVAMVDGRRGIRARPGPQRWWAASPSPSGSTRARTSSRSSWPTSSPRWPAPGRSSRCCSVWQPGDVVGEPAGPRPAMAGGESGVDQRRFEKDAALRADAGPDGTLKRDTPAEIITAFSPYLILIAVFALAQIHWLPFFDWLDARTKAFDWPGLHVLNAKGKAPTAIPSSSTGPTRRARCC